MGFSLDKLHEKANEAAVSGDYKQAVTINQQIIDVEPGDIDTYLRLGFAHMQLGNFPEAKKIYRRVLRIEPLNQIVRNNLEKISILEKKDKPKESNNNRHVALDPNLFLNIMGKTKEITLVNIGQADILATLKIGESVFFKAKKRRLEVRNAQGDYIGALPDDISRRLIYFLDAGSEYHVFVKAALKNTVDVFIREEKKGRKVKSYVSFPKNIQDDLKLMGNDDDADETKDESGDSAEHEDVLDEETPTHIDLEQLAQQAEEAELYPHETDTSEDEDEE